MKNSFGFKYRNAILAVLLMITAVQCLSQENNELWKKQGRTLIENNLSSTGINKFILSRSLITDAYPDKKAGTFLVYVQQTHLGIPVFNRMNVYVFKNGLLVSRSEKFIRKVQAKAEGNTSYNINPMQSVRAAANYLSISSSRSPVLLLKNDSLKQYRFTGEDISMEKIDVSLVWLPVQGDSLLKLAWNVHIVPFGSPDNWYIRVDARTGLFLEKNNLTVHERFDQSLDDVSGDISTLLKVNSDFHDFQRAAVHQPVPYSPPLVTGADYRVLPFPIEAPNFGSRALENNPWLKAGSGNNAVTLGWHFDSVFNYEITRGNNVWAQSDPAGTSDTTSASDTSTTSIPVLTFDRVLNTSQLPSAGSNLAAGTDNLFYWNNLMHDITYQYGFDEPAGNFQRENLGRGGFGDDYVNAFAQDGAGLSNANFGTPPDGFSPRMRMYLFNAPSVANLIINSPGSIAGTYAAVENNLSANNRLTYIGPVTSDIVLVNDSGLSTHIGCNTISNGASLAGKIALIDRGGTCGFAFKIKNAQNNGAVGVIVSNNVATSPIVMGGFDNSIVIPAVMISQANGNTIKTELLSNPVNGTLSATGGVQLDGDLDNGVISHEYTHGISNRLTGGPSNVGCLFNAEQMGEGWSDYLALMVTTNWSTAQVSDGPNPRPIGTYVLNQAPTGPGIRNYPYSTNLSVNPLTYADVAGPFSAGGEVHNIGEIWCATLWDMTWNIIQQEGIDPDLYHGTGGNNIALQLVMEGMKLQPCSPGFIDGRDAILKADSILYNYSHKCAIWNAFARRGMGKSASEGSPFSYTDQVTATDLPSGISITHLVDKPLVNQGDQVTYTLKAYCDCSALNNLSITDTLPPRLTYQSSSGGSFSAPVVTFSGNNFSPGEVKTFTITATVNAPAGSSTTLINDTRDPAGYAWTLGTELGTIGWVDVTNLYKSATHSFYAADLNATESFYFRSGDVLLDTIATLNFWHLYETEPSYDGGVVEMSTNGGSSWIDLGPYMIQNGYNNTLDPGTPIIGNRSAFSGSSGGNFILTKIAMPGFAGQSARFRFRFTSDAFVGYDGWYIDDIAVKNEPGIYNAASIFSGSTLLSRSSALSLYNSASLPVNFLSFDAKKINEYAALLSWKVTGERNSDRYEVERSVDGVRFAVIGKLKTTAAGGTENRYSFQDNNPVEGVNYYRVVQYDLDGRFVRTVIRSLDFHNTYFDVKVSPVPAYNQRVILNILMNTDSKLTGELTDLSGRLIRLVSLVRGIQEFYFGGLSAGIYLLKVRPEGQSAKTVRILVQ